ncbi:MAG: hypothetical protein LAO20_14370 [Acidobacteriia bacterium]|nr:hypothetical protein [Terriglobia bacterium]
MKKTLFLFLAFVAIGCAAPKHTVKLYILDPNVPQIVAQDKNDYPCKKLGFCSEFAYELLSGDRVCYGPDYRVDVATDPLKRCWTVAR